MHEDVLICTLICRRSAYVLDLFLANQQEIQSAYPNCRLILATDESDYAAELKELIIQHKLKGDVIFYETIKPEYAKTRIWSITCGREALRKYAVSNGAEYLMFMDADMTYDPYVLNIVKSEIKSFDVLFSGFNNKMEEGNFYSLGGGCTVINNKILKKICFSCREFKNGQIIDEFESLDVELFRCHARVKKGIFFANKHYANGDKHFDIQRGELNWIRKMTNSLLVRYLFAKVNILTHHNTTMMVRNFLSRNSRILNESKLGKR